MKRGVSLMKIRIAVPADAQGIAEVHVASWRSTYRGIVSDAYLAQLNTESKKEFWESQLNLPEAKEFIFVAEHETDGIVGFISGGKTREPELVYGAEIYAVYILQSMQQQGIGTGLFQALSRAFKRNGYTSMMLWVIEGNPSTAFYKKMGGQEVVEEGDQSWT